MQKVILGFPYDGALFWHLNPNENSRKKREPYSGTHPYYRRLYGPQHIKIAPKAASLCVLYDEVIIAPADAGLPDHREYKSGAGYYNPHLGLRTSWEEFFLVREWLEEQVRKDLESPAIRACLPEDTHAQRFILERTNLQIFLALKHNAKILAGGGFFRILRAKFAHQTNSKAFEQSNTEATSKLDLMSDYFDIACLQFRDLDYDRMVALRTDKKLRTYARSFHKVLGKAVATEDPSSFFFAKMKTDMERKDLLLEVDRGFSTGGAVVSLAALNPLLAPLLSPLRSAINIGRTAVDQMAQNKSWVLLGSRMSELLLKEWTKQHIR